VRDGGESVKVMFKIVAAAICERIGERVGTFNLMIEMYDRLNASIEAVCEVWSI